MKFIKDPLLGFICSLFGLMIHPVAFLLASGAAYWYHQPYYALGTLPFLFGLLAVVFSNWDDQKDVLDNDRGDLPGWAWIYATPDERLPGDVVGEPTVRWIYQHLGKYVCSAYWLLVRNGAMGLAFSLGRKTDTFLNGDLWGYQETPDGAWRYLVNLGVVYIGVGNQTTARPGEGIYCIPWFTVKRIRGDKP